MNVLFAAVLLATVAIISTLCFWRWRDHLADRAEMDWLLSTQPVSPPAFDLMMVAALPETVRRFFEYAILPGTPLFTVAEISMTGRFGMGTKEAPNYLDMTATQILAPPTGFIWKMQAGCGLMRISGSDSAAWTRFWIADMIPVARLCETVDHRRSAFGRYIAEAVIWTPAALLPGPNVHWQALDEVRARVTITLQGLRQSVDLTIDLDGRPTSIEFARWSDANSEKIYQNQPFGGLLSEHREFQGFRVPTHIEAGNFFGTDAYFPFFVAEVSDVRFPSEIQK